MIFRRVAYFLIAAFLVAGSVLYWRLSETLWKTYPYQDRTFEVPETVDLAEGKRKAQIAGCYTACHGSGGRGKDFYGYAAPNLTRLAKDYSDAEMERIVRQGIRPDGTSVYGMSSEMLQFMSDEDLGNIIAFLRSVPVAKEAVAYRDISLENLWRIVKGDAKPKVSQVFLKTPPKKIDKTDKLALGRYLAHISCTECHGVDFKGLYGPGLIIATAYDFEAFKRAITEGIAMDGRQLQLMYPIADSNFSKFTEAELEALYTYLNSDTFVEQVGEEG